MPETVPSAKKWSLSKVSKHLVIALSIFVVLLLASALTFYFNSQNNQSKTQFSSTKPSTPLPVRPLPSGKQTYTYSSTNVIGPVPSEVTIDPLTPPVGGNQTILVKIKYSSPVTKAGVILNTDNKVTEFPLELIAGTATDGTWKGSWTMSDSYNNNYYLQFDIQSDLGNYEHGLRFR